jgi:NADH-quinone oxidoreductase subunit L
MDMIGQFDVLGLIVLFPLLGAIINGLAGPKLPRKLVDWIGCGAIFVSFLFSMVAFRALNAMRGADGDAPHLTYTAYEWIYTGDTMLDISFLLDPLSAVMILVITGVGFLIHVYSVGYMEGDPSKWRFFSYLNLFCFAMLLLVLGKNMLVTFIGWEGVGVCSYLLIGFWYQDTENAIFGQKAFIVNRVGDFAFLAGLFLLFFEAGTFDYVELEAFATNPATAVELLPVALPAAILIFIGCTGKSAQIPLFTWLPDAMAGPTPVSALIHAATMVTAGVFLIGRLHFLFTLSPWIGTVVATVGALTAFFAATVALAQDDIKKVLAYSTISQLGYMFVAVGVGAFTAAIFHLVTHAFFKALLFLGSGSVIHGMQGDQNIQNMGGLKKWMPTTRWTFLAATLAISGFPLFSGWFSKDLILWKSLSKIHLFHVPEVLEGGASIDILMTNVSSVIHSGAGAEISATAAVFHIGIYALGVITAGLTALYMFRLYFLTFEGECRAEPKVQEHIHESPVSMTVPLTVLAILSIVAGYIGLPHFVKGILPKGLKAIGFGFEHWLHGTFAVSNEYRYISWFGHHPYAQEMMSTALSTLVALGGIGLAYFLYIAEPELPAELTEWNWSSKIYRVLNHKYWVDEIYDWTFVQGTLKVGALLTFFDKYIVDSIVDGTAWMVEQSGEILKHLQSGNVQRYATHIVFGLLLILIAIFPECTPVSG